MFQDRFTDKVRDGSKTTTIRKTDWHIKPGTVLSLRRWTGKPYRSKQEVLREVKCADVQKISIESDSIWGYMTFGYSPMCGDAREIIAQHDGFDSFADMVDWFKKNHGLPFEGHIIRWEEK